MAAQVNSLAKSLWNTLSAFQDKSSGNVIKSADWDEIAAAILLTQVTEKDGSSLRMGSGVPASSLGADGDWYFNKASTTIYRKDSGSWVEFTSSGAAGNGAIWAEANLAGLQGLGSGDGLTEDDIGIARDTGLLYRCTAVTGASTSAWGGVRLESFVTRVSSSIGDGGGYASLDVNAASGNSSDVNFRHNSLREWRVRSDGVSDTLSLARFSADSFQDFLATFSGSTGAITLGNGADITLASSVIPSGNRNVGSSAAQFQALWSVDKCRIRAAAATANFTARKGERVLYDASGGGFTITAPASANLGDRFAIKEVAGDATAVTINGNSSSIEDPIAGTTPSNFSFGVARASVEWEYDGSIWRVI